MVDFERLLRPNPFAGDDGGVQPQMASALALTDAAERQEALVAALATGRVFVPVQAHAHPGYEDGSVVSHVPSRPNEEALEEASELTVPAPGGLRAMPVLARRLLLLSLMRRRGRCPCSDAMLRRRRCCTPGCWPWTRRLRSSHSQATSLAVPQWSRSPRERRGSLLGLTRRF